MDVFSFRDSRVVVGDLDSPVSNISVEGGVIVGIESDESKKNLKEEEFERLTLMPGYIDVHNHGAVGIDVNEADTEGLLKIAGFLARSGVTAWMPTLVPDSDENYCRAINAIDELMAIQTDKPIAQAVGVHYEGVFASEKMCGALRPEYFKKWGGRSSEPEERTTPSAQIGGHPSFVRRRVAELPRLKNGVHMTTVAPEVDWGIELIETLVAEGWVVSIGHTRAEVETLQRAYVAGARHMTHFFNAMTGLHHRDLGAVGWGFTNQDVTFDIIADGIHVDPKILEFAVRNKSPEKVSLISDSIAPTGLGDGEYELWGEKISVKNGRTQNERGSIAGSVITILDAVKRMLALGFSEIEVSQMASRNPARILGIDGTHGTIAVGRRADLVALDSEGNVRFVMIGGQIVDLQ